jgi:hypothetical protein
LEDAPELPAELTTIMPLEKQSQLHGTNAVSIHFTVRMIIRCIVKIKITQRSVDDIYT